MPRELVIFRRLASSDYLRITERRIAKGETATNEEVVKQRSDKLACHADIAVRNSSCASIVGSDHDRWHLSRYRQ
jgi:hypothetical protein